MQSLETDSPAPYIALGIPKEEKEEREVKKVKRYTKSILFFVEIAFCSIVLYLCITQSILHPVISYKILVTHEYKKPLLGKVFPEYYNNEYWYETWDNNFVNNFLKNHEDDTEDFYDAEDSINDRLYDMCKNAVPLEWPKEWRDDPQLLTARMKDDLSFCNTVFNELYN